MRRTLAYTLIGTLALTAGCAASEPPNGGTGEGVHAARHPDARLSAIHGGAPFKIDVRYVSLLGRSVIVVREGVDATGGRKEIRVADAAQAPGEEPFSSVNWRPVALEIADGAAHQAGVCADGAPMEILHDADGEARTIYRPGRSAWVVFARCPAAG